MPTLQETNKEVVRQYMQEGVNHGDVSVADQIFAPDFRFHFPGVPAPMDRAGWAQLTQAFQMGFPNQDTTVNELLADGDKVAARFTFRGTQSGEFQQIPPTGKAVTMTGMAFWRLAGGKIAEHWVETDALGMLQQLGVVPLPQTA